MSRPLLQLALDHTSLAPALADVKKFKDHVDIIEAGTILCLSEGLNALRSIRPLIEGKIMVADWKVADAAETLAKQAFDAGANFMTIICAAPLATMEKGQMVASSYGGEIQIELFGNWTLEDAKAWRSLGIKQAIYHRGRDAQASGQEWSAEDLDKMRALSDLGLELSVTGGITPNSLATFKDINVKAFIAGRALSNAEDGLAAARAFNDAITDIWGA